MRGQHDVVKALGTAFCDDAHAGAIRVLHPLDQLHRRVQAFVGDAFKNLVDVIARTALHRVPLRPVGDLQQAVVVAKADHGGHRELQHLVGRAAPDAADHRQKIPLAKLVAECVLV